MTEAPWVQLWGGGRLCLQDPVITDLWPLVRAIGGLRRFNNHTRWPIFVTQHSVAVSLLVPPAARAYALLHDLHEGVTGDIPTPVKRMLGFETGGALDALCDRLDLAIWRAAGLPPPDETIRAAVRAADAAVLMAERRDALHPPPSSWGALEDIVPAGAVTTPMGEMAALALFVRYAGGVLPSRCAMDLLKSFARHCEQLAIVRLNDLLAPLSASWKSARAPDGDMREPGA